MDSFGIKLKDQLTNLTTYNDLNELCNYFLYITRYSFIA